MFGKIVSVAALVLLPFSLSTWHASHNHPQFRRFDATLYKSLEVRLNHGKCCLSLLSMPSKVASKSQFSTPSNQQPPEMKRTILFRSRTHGPYRTTWIVFPLWLPPLFLLIAGIVPISFGPIRRLRRRRNGWCLHCGYNLAGNRSGRCPECGMRFGKPIR